MTIAHISSAPSLTPIPAFSIAFFHHAFFPASSCGISPSDAPLFSIYSESFPIHKSQIQPIPKSFRARFVASLLSSPLPSTPQSFSAREGGSLSFISLNIQIPAVASIPNGAVFSVSHSFTSATSSFAFSFHSAMTFSAFSFAMVVRASLADFNPRAAPSVKKRNLRVVPISEKKSPIFVPIAVKLSLIF